MEWSDLPCATCSVFEPTREEPVKARPELVETRNENTWGTGPIDMGKHEQISEDAERLKNVLDFGSLDDLKSLLEALDKYTISEMMILINALSKLTAAEITAIAGMIRGHRYGWSQVKIAKELGVTKQAINHTMKSVEAKVPSLARIIRPYRK